MDIEQLKQFEAVARTGTLQAAAKELALSQSALSRSLRRLEADLGHELFSRTHNSMQLNAEGTLALEHARTILAEERHLRDNLDTLERRTRTVRVASVAPAPTWRLSALVLEQQPTTILEPDLAPEAEVEQRLLNGTCDLAVTMRNPQLPTIQAHELMREDLYANVPAGHPLHERAALSFAELDGETFLLYREIGFWMEVHRRKLPHASFVIQPDRTIFLQQVQTSSLVTFTTNAPENTSAHAARRAIPITDAEAHVTYHLCARTDAPPRIQQLYTLISETES